eukprot:TRINITY_DN78191_c0_g1_i1.p1 TRINITY_DN78191_c0_g1~~TRINITY_DN78191_c0_g1_i1.p1  ORF type:complete len:271 (+),score=61.56 TRINITY_DN78191_c0_g1_i1:60-872(+)
MAGNISSNSGMQGVMTLRGTAIDGDGGLDLEHSINGRPGFATVSFNLKPGQPIMAESGSLMWCDESLQIHTHMSGGCCDAFWRGCSGEPCCMNDYIGPGRATFGFIEPGDALTFAVTPSDGWILTKKAFICATPGVMISSRYAGCLTTCCTDEGPFFTQITTKESLSLFWAGSYGEIVRHEIPDGKSLLVDGGLFFAAHRDTNVEITFLGDICTACCSGEGIIMKFKGPATVYCQSRDPAIFDAIFLPQKNDEEEKKEAGAEIASAAISS